MDLTSVSWFRICPPFTELKVRFGVLKNRKLNEILNELRPGLLHLILRVRLIIVLLAANSVRLLLRSGVLRAIWCVVILRFAALTVSDKEHRS